MRNKCVFPLKLALLMVAFYLVPGSILATGEEAFTESVVIFNTICEKCHEAQCSGRLSFDDSFDASVNHIVRVYGEASEKKWLQKELFVILNNVPGSLNIGSTSRQFSPNEMSVVAFRRCCT